MVESTQLQEHLMARCTGCFSCSLKVWQDTLGAGQRNSLKPVYVQFSQEKKAGQRVAGLHEDKISAVG